MNTNETFRDFIIKSLEAEGIEEKDIKFDPNLTDLEKCGLEWEMDIRNEDDSKIYNFIGYDKHEKRSYGAGIKIKNK